MISLQSSIYSLPFNCPIEWPIKPNYPIASPVRDLNQVYFNTLFNKDDQQPLQFALDNFARLLLSLTSEQTSESLIMLLRSLILPAKEFDKRWRYTIPEVFKPPQETLTGKKEKEKEKERLSEGERGKLLECHERWKENNKKNTGVTNEKLEVAGNVMIDGNEPEVRMEETGSSKPETWLVQDDKIGEWLRDLETLETLIQSLLLLTLLCLPPPSLPSPPLSSATKNTAPSRRRTKNPQRSNTTLDPEILLDFLTDRLQVWAAIKSMTGTGLGKDVNGIENVRIELERDVVQCWWEDIVEPLFSPHLLPDLLLHHRLKLFPSTSSTFALSTAASYVPSPSPYKKSSDRSLLSLDKSARRKEWQEEKNKIPESPTMRRLAINGGSRLGSGNGNRMGIGREEEVFKVPVAPRRRSSISGSSTSSNSTSHISGQNLDPFLNSMTTEEASNASNSTTTTTSFNPTSSKSRSRKQERPRPTNSTASSSSRGDNMISSLKGLFNHREVSLARRPNGSASSSNLTSTSSTSHSDSNTSQELNLPFPKVKSLGMTAEGRTRTRKRKSLSPRKVPPSESTFLFSSSSSSHNSRTFPSSTSQILAVDTPLKSSKSTTTISRPKIALPSFAALGAAFRPGLPPTMELPRGIPNLPILSDDEQEEEEEEDRMDWEDFGGRAEGKGRVMMGTPVRKTKGNWCVPDT